MSKQELIDEVGAVLREANEYSEKRWAFCVDDDRFSSSYVITHNGSVAIVCLAPENALLHAVGIRAAELCNAGRQPWDHNQSRP